jgi:predicted DNA-binding transcriptional regulator AlpA
MDPMGTQDIAELLGVSRQRAHQLVAREGFPAPVHTINTRTKVWDRDQVVEWAVEHRYDITPPPNR